MTWFEAPAVRSIRCNGEMVRFLRKQRGWTQERLATAAGYTKRLVAKAESSGSLNPDTIEILAETRAAVDAFHAAALEMGGTSDGEPGPRPHYHPNYYGAYVRDPEGNKIQAVCHSKNG